MDEARKVLIVVRGLDPVGTGRQVEVAAETLAAAGHAVTIAVTTAGGGTPARLVARGFGVERVGDRPVGDVAATLRLAGLVRRLRPGVILGFGRSQAFRVALARRCAPHCRGLVWLGLPPSGPRQAWALGRLDAVIATSVGVGDACRRAGIAARRIVVVPPAASAPPASGLPRHEIAARLGLDAALIWTLAVAPLESSARLSRLLWAIDQLGVVRHDLQHVLVGAGPLRTAVARQSRVQEIAERLFLMPNCDVLPDLLGEVGLVWQSGDVALGGAVLDGQARGVPAVAVESEAAGHLIVDGLTGRIVPPLPESELPRRVFGLLEDGDLMRRYAAAAAARSAEVFPAARFAAGLLSVVRGGA
ncbi:MAG: glycosyltransferase [Planctomycetes bacterium]|nr:glycosyltransferase [Planctomycetota bacterium]